MTIKENPWEEIAYGAQRRAVMKQDIFWVKESKGDYGICIEIKNTDEVPSADVDLKDIEIIKNLDTLEDVFKWYLILRNREEWQIFKVLCNDLIEAVDAAKSEKAMIIIIESRLKRWQNLLKKRLPSSLSIEIQMGLFSELHCLKNIITSKVDISSSIQLWGGPDSDKQDFLLDDMAVEVKSYKTSKGDKVTISSKEQLTSEKENLYLVTYALTTSENGQNIKNLVDEIKFMLRNNSDFESIDLLDFKLLEYGYSPILHKEEQLEKFIVDKIRLFHVEEQFPKITTENVPSEIVSINYKIDLSRCSQFEIELGVITN